MQLMKKPVNSRSQKHTDIGNEGNTTENGIKRRENLAAVGLYFGHRTHARKNHGSIVQRVNPHQITEEMVTQNPDAETNS